MQRGIYHLAIIFIGLLLVSIVGTATGDFTVTWDRTYGGPDSREAAYDIIASPDGDGFFLVGESTSPGVERANAWVVRLTSEGDEVWNRTYGREEVGAARSVSRAGDGSLIIAGNITFVTDGAGMDTDAWLAEIDLSGAELWNRTYGGSDVNASVNAVIGTADGGYAFVGSISSRGMEGSDVWVVRLNDSGDMIWERRFGDVGAATAHDIVQLSDDGFVFVGSIESPNSDGMDTWIVRLNESGDEIWSRAFGGPYDDHARAVVTTTDGNLLVAGVLAERSEDGSIDTDALLIKLKPDGDIIWNWIYGDAGVNESANAVIETHEGDYVFAGDIGHLGAGDTDAWLVGTDSGGAVAWSRTFGGPNPGDRATSLLQVGECGYVFAGIFNATKSKGVVNEDAWVVRLGFPTESTSTSPPTVKPISPPKAPVVSQKPVASPIYESIHRPPADQIHKPTGPLTHRQPVTSPPVPISTPASIGGLVWNDTGGDGIHDSEEPGISGVGVTLLDTRNNAIETEATGVDGRYLFADLEPGDYIVEFTPPGEMIFTVQKDGDARGSDVNQTTGRTDVIILKAGEEQLHWDAGLTVEVPLPPEPGLVTGVVRYDVDLLGDTWSEILLEDSWYDTLSGYPGVRVELMRADDTLADMTLTGKDGSYAFSVDEPGHYYLQFASPRSWGTILVPLGPECDLDPETGTTAVFEVVPSGTVTRNEILTRGSPPLSGTIWCDINENGVRDPGEPGIPGVYVLQLSGKPFLVGSAITGPDGSYHFPARTCYWGHGGIQIYPPEGYRCTVLGPDNDVTQASCTQAWIGTEGFTEIGGEILNIGLVCPRQTVSHSETYGWVHGTVWIDENQDGVRDEESGGFAGIEVQLLDSEGVVMESAHTSSASQFSDIAYLLGPLPPGEYSLVFIPPEGYTFTDQGRDSHADPVTGRVGPFTVGGNEVVVRDAGLVATSRFDPDHGPTAETAEEENTEIVSEPNPHFTPETEPDESPEMPETAPEASLEAPLDLSSELESDLVQNHTSETESVESSEMTEVAPEVASEMPPDLSSEPEPDLVQNHTSETESVESSEMTKTVPEIAVEALPDLSSEPEPDLRQDPISETESVESSEMTKTVPEIAVEMPPDLSSEPEPDLRQDPISETESVESPEMPEMEPESALSEGEP